jgi:hypothetical protein
MIKITGSTLLKFYLYLISLITLTAALFSGAMILKAGLSYFAPLQFSYYLYEASSEEDIKQAEIDGYELEECYYGEATEIEGHSMCWDESERKQDLVNGIAIFSSMMILFGLHQLGIQKTKKLETPRWLVKSYTILSLLVYSITGLIAIPTAIYETTNYFLTSDIVDLMYAPAYSIGLVIFVLPLWFIFFNKTLNLKDE